MLTALCVSRGLHRYFSPLQLGAKRFMAKYTSVEKGAPYSKDYKVFFKGPNGPISPFHDIPLYTNADRDTVHMIVEIPRWTNAKMEICKEQKLNPIVQDIKKGNLRFVDNVFPYHGYIWNYGAIPQTWEDPNHVDNRTNAKGDNDPLDVCEIGSKVHPRGAIIQVKPLGLLGLIDEGETDWKILVIDVTDPKADQMNDLDDIEIHYPGFMSATREWFKVYKIPQGKPPNEFAFDGEFKNREFARSVIEETHKQWQDLVGHQVDAGGICCDNVSVVGSPYLIEKSSASDILDKCPAPAAEQSIPQAVDTWHFVKA